MVIKMVVRFVIMALGWFALWYVFREATVGWNAFFLSYRGGVFAAGIYALLGMVLMEREGRTKYYRGSPRTGWHFLGYGAWRPSSWWAATWLSAVVLTCVTYLEVVILDGMFTPRGIRVSIFYVLPYLKFSPSEPVFMQLLFHYFFIIANCFWLFGTWFADLKELLSELKQRNYSVSSLKDAM